MRAIQCDGKATQIARANTLTNAELLTVEEVATLLKVDKSWVYERTRRRSVDRIPGFRLGKYWRFRETDVLAWLERQQRG
jgi:excisionase family DNA binding protein